MMTLVGDAAEPVVNSELLREGPCTSSTSLA